MLSRRRRMPGLTAPVAIRHDEYGRPDIEAASRPDAFLALGYLTARDRLFQMDVLRRVATGRLSEVLGPATVDVDREQRTLGIAGLAERALARIPAEHRAVLEAYVAGVNEGIRRARPAPLEFHLLRYRPDPWTAADSAAVGLLLFQQLTRSAEADERRVTVMSRTLPEDVVAFLTSDEDGHETTLVGGPRGRRPRGPVPAASLAALLRARPTGPQAAISHEHGLSGSNGWAIAGSRTRDGRAILANDLHLDLAVPNTWYAASLRYGRRTVSGTLVPGVPMVMVGGNSRVAWGFTVMLADVLDLVELEVNPDDPSEYRTPAGWRRFEVRRERIQVRGSAAVDLAVRSTIWGPVSPRRLLGRPVAVRWTALDLEAFDLGLLDLDAAADVEQAAGVLRAFGGPPMHAMLADAGGRVAWTCSGRLPVRRGLDGSTSRSWADGSAGWDGVIPPGDLPGVADPDSGVLVTANNRAVGAALAHAIDGNFSSGFRADRAAALLGAPGPLDEARLAALQLDTRAEVYEFFRELALRVLDEAALRDRPALRAARASIEGWDGRADRDSRGLALLAALRQALFEATIGVYLAACREADDEFAYTWGTMDVALRAILTARLPETLPGDGRHAGWDELVLTALETGADRLRRAHPRVPPERLPWGGVNRADIQHPLARAVRPLRGLLSMPPAPLAGCHASIRVAAPSVGAAIRLVLSPAHPEDGMLTMACGQSGNPFSRHYRDQQPHWLAGRGLAYVGPRRGRPLVLVPPGREPAS